MSVPLCQGSFWRTQTAPSIAFSLFCPLNFFCHHLHLIFSQINSRDRFRHLLRSVCSAPAQHSWGLSSDCARFVMSSLFLPGTQESWPFISEHWGLPEPVTIRSHWNRVEMPHYKMILTCAIKTCSVWNQLQSSSHFQHFLQSVAEGVGVNAYESNANSELIQSWRTAIISPLWAT